MTPTGAPPVLVVGDAVLDVTVLPGDPPRTGLDVPGEVAVGPGGQGANIAVRLARRGPDVTLVAGLADDAAGALVADRLQADGVALHKVSVAATGAVLALLDAHGERSMVSQRSPFADRLSAEPPAVADWLVVSGYLLPEAGAASAARSLRSWAPRRCLVGCWVSDAALPAWRTAATELDPDVVILNADEAERLGSDFAERRVVTSRHGATARVGEVRARITAPEVPRVLDATGAGDAFAAVLLAELIGSWPPGTDALSQAMEVAAVVAAEVTQVRGAQAPVPAERRIGAMA